MMNEGVSVADALALRNSGYNDGNNGWGDGGSWWIIIFLIFAFMGWGRNGFSNNGGDGGNGGYNACCTPATAQGVTDAFNLSQLDNGIRGLERGQDAIRCEVANGVKDIMIENDKNTDRILNYLTQNENEKLRTELQSAQFQLSQLSQTSNIINQLMPVAKPAYIPCSPYAAAMGYPYANNGYGCGCNSGCGCA